MYILKPEVNNSIEKNNIVELTGEPCDSTVANCAWDLRGFIYTAEDIVKTQKVYYGKNDLSTPITDYYDKAYKEDQIDELLDDYSYDNDTTVDDLIPRCGYDNCTQIDSSLFYIVYYPKHNYDACPLHAIFLFHAGGFSDCSAPYYEDDLCRMFARKGFVVILVEYRRGRIKDENDGGKYIADQQMLATYRAGQDARGAVRSAIFAQQDTDNPLPYKFDLSNIIVAGQSAGATLANSLGYYTSQSMINEVYPVPVGELPFLSVLGPIDADFYIGPPSLEIHSRIKIVINMWGGLPIPTDSSGGGEYNYLSQNRTQHMPAMIGFMGAQDPVFPPKRKNQWIYYPPNDSHNSEYTSESDCLIDAPSRVFGTTKKFRIECSKDLYKILISNGIPSLQYIDCNMGHGLEHPDPPGSPITTNFGMTSISTTYLADVNNYMASRSAVFIQAYLNTTLSSFGGISKFTDCEDSRHSPKTGGGCANSSNHDVCPDGCDAALDDE